MNNPYEDLEYLAEFLPEEGESVIVTRRRGQLVCESYFETHATPPAQAGLIDREFYGRLTTIETSLQTHLIQSERVQNHEQRLSRLEIRLEHPGDRK